MKQYADNMKQYANNMKQQYWLYELWCSQANPIRSDMNYYEKYYELYRCELYLWVWAGAGFWTARQKDDSCFEVVEVAEVISWPESHFPTPPLEAIVHGKRMEEGRCLYEN